MAKVIQLSSAENPRIKEILHLRKNRQRRRTGVFIAEGRREIERALAARLTIRQFFYCPELVETWEVLDEARHGEAAKSEIRNLEQFQISNFKFQNQDVEFFSVPLKILVKITYLEKPEGCVAIFDEPRWELGNLPMGDLWLIVTGIEKPGNLGAMARTASAAGCAGLLVADEIVDAFNPNAIRASTGAVFSLPIVEASSERVIAFCGQRNIQIVAAAPQATARYTDVDFTKRTAIVIGAEHAGLSDIWKSEGVQVEIPMRTLTVDSLNASTAAAILLFEAVRQRKS